MSLLPPPVNTPTSHQHCRLWCKVVSLAGSPTPPKSVAGNYISVAVLSIFMAEELRWETLRTVATTDTNAFGTFTNTTKGTIHIRSMDIQGFAQADTAAAASSAARVQVSKSNTIDDNNNSTIFQANTAVSSLNLAAGAGNGGGPFDLTKLYARGQLTLEPGESLFGHLGITNTITDLIGMVTFGYHFED